MGENLKLLPAQKHRWGPVNSVFIHNYLILYWAKFFNRVWRAFFSLSFANSDD